MCCRRGLRGVDGSCSSPPILEFVVEEVDVVDDLSFEESVELFGVDPVGAFDFPVKPLGRGLDVDMADALVEQDSRRFHFSKCEGPRLPRLERRSWAIGGTKRIGPVHVGSGRCNTSGIVDVVLSSRRVKKGPGRRPLSAKRQKFMELRERGWSIRAAAREVGVSRSSGNNWSSGYKTYRKGELVGFVPPLDRLTVRQISARFLSQEERIEIADLRSAGLSLRQIAAKLSRAPSTISRELRRNTVTIGVYRPFDAHRRATLRRARHHARRVESNIELRELLVELLGQRWSPSQISRHLRLRFPDEPRMRLSHESIYQALYEPGSVFLRPSRLAPHRRSPLRTGRDHRRAHQSSSRRRPRFQQPLLTIH